MKTIVVVVVAVLVFGFAASGGPVRREDGTIDASATLAESAEKGGAIAGRGVDDVGNSLGGGLGQAIGESDLAKVAAAGAAAAAVVKYGPKWKPKPAPAPTAGPPPTVSTQPPPRRHTGWCTDILTGAVAPCAPKPSATTSTTASAVPRFEPMSPGFTAPTFKLPEATWKPCVATPGIIVSC